MAHQVELDAVVSQILNIDVIFRVKKDGQTLGDLKVSKGGVAWRPAKKRHGGNNEVKLSWSRFHKQMTDKR